MPKPERKPDRHLVARSARVCAFVLGNRMLRSIAMCTGSGNFFSSMSGAVLFVLLARDLSCRPADRPAHLGLGRRRHRRLARRHAFANRFGQGPAIWISAITFAPGAFVRRSCTGTGRLVLLALGQLVVWVSNVVYNITQVSFRQGCARRTCSGG